MIAKIFIDNDWIGNTVFRITDESMGGIDGVFEAREEYKKFKLRIQLLTKEKGITNISDFNFRIIIEEEELNPIGGIGITDFKNFDEIIIESAGNHLSIIERIKKGII